MIALTVLRNGSSKDDGWIVLVFSHVNNVQPFGISDLLSGAECMSVLGAWLRTIGDCGHYVDA